MSGTKRLPAGGPRKASQRRAKSAAHPHAPIARSWNPGESLFWKGRAGIFRRDVGDGEYAEIVIADRIYRVQIGELT
jgi:hypothetical protein